MVLSTFTSGCTLIISSYLSHGIKVWCLSFHSLCLLRLPGCFQMEKVSSIINYSVDREIYHSTKKCRFLGCFRCRLSDSNQNHFCPCRLLEEKNPASQDSPRPKNRKTQCSWWNSKLGLALSWKGKKPVSFFFFPPQLSEHFSPCDLSRKSDSNQLLVSYFFPFRLCAVTSAAMKDGNKVCRWARCAVEVIANIAHVPSQHNGKVSLPAMWSGPCKKYFSHLMYMCCLMPSKWGEHHFHQLPLLSQWNE